VIYQIHIVPNAKGGWDVVQGGVIGAIRHFTTKQVAIEFGRELCKKNHGELFIHGLDGKIQSRDSYGNDPYPPKG
jgi:hypothetical protein